MPAEERALTSDALSRMEEEEVIGDEPCNTR